MSFLINSANEQAVKPFSVSYHTPATQRTPSNHKLLEERWLHKLFLLSHVPATWPGWKLAISLLLLAFVVGLIWWPVGPGALVSAGIYLIFALVDWLVVWWLPRSGRSFGPIGPQLLVQTVPRLAVAIFSTLLALLSGSYVFALWIHGLLQLVGTIIYWQGSMVEPFVLDTTHRPVQSAALPPNSLPIRLLHLSDLHVERLTRRESRRLFEIIEKAQPDIIVITGDYLNLSYVNDPTARADVRKVLARLEAPFGVYATLGSPPADPRDTTPSLFDDLDVRLLRDEVAVLNFADGRSLSLLGLDCEHDLAVDGSVFQQLVELAPANSMRLLLYHSPELMPLVQQHPVELYLCGHTHGGQIRFPFYGALITSSVTGKRYEMGPYLEQNTLLYVSRGIGLEGLSAPRMRLLCPPEVILFTLSGDNSVT